MPSIPSAVLDNGAASGGSGSAPLPSIAAATAGVDAATAARRVAGLRPNPEVQAQVENIAGTGVYKGLRSSETTVGVALPLEGQATTTAEDRLEKGVDAQVTIFGEGMTPSS